MYNILYKNELILIRNLRLEIQQVNALFRFHAYACVMDLDIKRRFLTKAGTYTCKEVYHAVV